MRSANLNNQAYQKLLDRAIKLHRQGSRQQSIRSLQRLLGQYPNSAAAHGYLASIYFENGDMGQAADHFRAAAKLNPLSEKASLGLFHSLWSSGLETEAVAEMRRFLSSSESPEYLRLLQDLTIDGDLVPKSTLARAV